LSEIDWSKYYLRDLPIPGKLPRVDVKSPDERINGRLFYEPVVHVALERLSGCVTQDVSPILLNSKDIVLGTGKSAVLAAEYWKLMDRGETCFWVEVTGISPMRRILLKVAYEMSVSGAIEKLKGKLASMGGIQQGIHRAPETKLMQRPLTRWMIGALLSQTEDFPIALANVTKKTMAFSVADAFIFLLELYNRFVSKRIFIFLDQLEIYVRYTNARQIAQEMNELQRGISDKAILLATMHTDALVKLQEKCGPDVQTFLENAPIIQLPQYSGKDLVDVGLFLLSKFRKGQAERFHPFTSESLGHIAKKSDHNIRRFLVRMRAALMLGATSGYPALDKRFLDSETARSRVFVETPITE
jgi:hypothetical protein